MKVGVDARLLANPITGLGRYTLEMCLALSQIKTVELYLYSPTSLTCPEILKNAVIRTGNSHGRVLRQIWAEIYLPSWIKDDCLDVFWGPAHRLPQRVARQIPSVLTIHDLVWKYAGETMRTGRCLFERYQMTAAIQVATRIVAVSHATALAIDQTFGVPVENITIVPNGVSRNVEPASASTLIEMGLTSPYCLFVGTLEPRKNLPRLLAAYARLPRSLKAGMNLVIAGGKGWGRANIAKIVTRLKLKQYVHLLGYVDEERLATLYANAYFLVMPSLYEGFGLPLIEAMAHGVPVLTSDCSSMPEVAGNTALLIDPYDIHSIEKGLLCFMTDSKLHAQLAARAKHNANQFNWGHSAEKLRFIFSKIA